MDIIRHWRLKSSRSQLLATRCPTSGKVILPQQSGTVTNAHPAETYTFEDETVDESHLAETETEYARAAR